MDETHDEHPIDPATIDDLQQFLSTFKNKTTQPKMKKAILAKIEAHFSVLARLKEEEGLDSTFHVLLCSLSVVILENFPMYSVIDWVEQGHDGWDDDTPWECFFLMPPYGFPAYIAPNRSADIRLPASRWVVDSTSIHEYSELVRSGAPRPSFDFTTTTDSEDEETSEDDSPSPPQSRKASRALNPLPGVGPPSSSGNHRSRKDDNEKRLSRGPTAVPKLNVAGGDNPSPGRQVSSRPADSKVTSSGTGSSPSRHSAGQIQSPSSNSKATPKTGGTVRPGSSSKPLLVPVAKTKELFESERPPKRRRLGKSGTAVLSTPEGSSSSSEGEDELDGEDEDEDLEEPYTPRQTRAMHQKSRTGGVDMKEEKEDVEAMPLSSSVKRSSRKRKQKVDDDNAEADDNTFEAPKPKPSKKRKNKKGKKKEDSPEVAAIYDSKGQRILVAPYLDSLPSALLQVSDPILEELEGELVVAPCSRCSLTGKECETQGFDKRCIVCKRGRQPCDLEFTAVRRPRRVTASAGFLRYEYASANLSRLAAEMEEEIASARIMLAMAHTHAQRGKAKKDLIGSIVHRLIANTSEAHAIEEIFGGQVEMFERFKCVFFQPLPSVGAGTFNMAQLLAAAKELSLVEFSKGTSNEEPGAVDEDGDIVEDAAMNGASRAPSPELAPDDGDAPMETV
ncbi:hypothetical protein BKA70DRAFT_1215932 [Coprinopsis sp. MPI-PUGE-AT-0042]|nr:hypothetical protein BKA70DRAFT_1239838 [Coprinopsis sp. MPI-PUGE-AT-0042]KAH6890035.1 hypothetical protein BKA70DRAFT_1442229 [Coprinopsis sp. MPI-PUGE-AT-0042]KAH6915556.1 hypothetical protein BKA70DRAFT_1215932 [Coprinopsis sp. MPI-PUGE-AT-0042]